MKVIRNEVKSIQYFSHPLSTCDNRRWYFNLVEGLPVNQKCFSKREQKWKIWKGTYSYVKVTLRRKVPSLPA
jgi:hypothetical protein